MRAFAELNDAGTRIRVYFKYDPNAVRAIKEVPGRRFAGDASPKHWTVPADLTTAKRLREVFGAGLELGDGLRAWGKVQQRAARKLARVAGADDAQLARVDEEAAAWLRPYQRADVAMMAATNVLNTNQPGTGKTVEVIYAAQEAGVAGGAHLVIAPITLHKDPWANELHAHAPEGTRIHWADTPGGRKNAMELALMDIKAGHPTWLIVNPDMIRAQRAEEGDTRPVLSRDHKGNAYVAKEDIAPLFQVQWATLTLDEFHKYGLGENRNTLFARAVDALGRNAGRRYALSGTPMGGKPVRLWGVLHFIEPQLYSSKWRWAEEWLVVSDNGFGKKIGGLQAGRDKEFHEAHARHMVRRDRADVLPGLPPKVVLDVLAPMTAKQKKVYNEFSRQAMVQLEGGKVSATGVLAEFARLKQLANALCTVDEDGKLWPTHESGKLPVLLDRLDTHGCGVGDAAQPGARAIVASESQRMVRMVTEWLRDQGINARRLDGTITGRKRTEVLDWYKNTSNSEARVLVMTTQTGGVGLNLGMTGSIHILDETWNPDDQEQLEDRGMRNRTTSLVCLYYRTAGTIQEYVQEVAAGKAINNANVLGLGRRLAGSM
jgi:SNF2 family DNA or RNA helicase